MVMPFIFATTPAGNVPASEIDTNLTFLESQGVQALTTTGTPNNYVATPADAWVIGYSQYIGRALTIVPNFTNTGVSSINVSGLGAVDIYKNVAGAPGELSAGDMVTGIPSVIICDGVNFLLVNPTVRGTVLQRVSTTFSSVATGSTVLPYDNTIPQNTEGDQYMTQAITPLSATSVLEINVIAQLSGGIASTLTGAIFRDSTANALAAAAINNPTAGGAGEVFMKTIANSGSVSATTFKFRAGMNVSGNTTFNGSAGSGAFGGVYNSIIEIVEYAA